MEYFQETFSSLFQLYLLIECLIFHFVILYAWNCKFQEFHTIDLYQLTQ